MGESGAKLDSRQNYKGQVIRASHLVLQYLPNKFMFRHVSEHVLSHPEAVHYSWDSSIDGCLQQDLLNFFIAAAVSQRALEMACIKTLQRLFESAVHDPDRK